MAVRAKNLRGVIKEMDRLHPDLGEHLVEETTVAIDGAIHETIYFQPIRPGCEVFFIPKLEGGQGLAKASLPPPSELRCWGPPKAPTTAAPARQVILLKRRAGGGEAL